MNKTSTYIIILAAGKATRLRPLSNVVPKPLIKIVGKALILRIISAFREAGFKKFLILVGYKGDFIKKEVQKLKDIDIKFVYQFEQKGMADGLALCLEYLIEKGIIFKNFFLTASDVIFSKQEIIQMYKLFKNSNADIVLSLMKSEDINIAKGHGNVKISKEFKYYSDMDITHGLKINEIIEKPEVNQILSDYYSLPLYLFNQKIFPSLKEIPCSPRGEREIQDAIRHSIKNGDNVRGIKIIKELITNESVGKYHLTNLKDIIKMNLRFASIENKTEKKSFMDIVIGDNCKIGYESKLSNTILFNNVLIGKECILDWCIIDENIEIPERFQAFNSFITKNEKDEIEIIEFR